MKLKFLIRHLPASNDPNNWIYASGIPIIITSNIPGKVKHSFDTLYFSGEESEESIKSKFPRIIIYELKKL